ncbi:hypothetical protein RYX36_021727, partial [Vicia faba]
MNVKGQGGSTSSSTSWCVVRSDASYNVLQTALDYACGSGADCLPLQPDELCFLPNTIQAHASYAFNSYYQKIARAPGSCDFSGTATIAQTDPSYGSCVYPSSTSGAGGSNTPTTSSSAYFFIHQIITTQYSLYKASIHDNNPDSARYRSNNISCCSTCNSTTPPLHLPQLTPSF